MSQHKTLTPYEIAVIAANIAEDKKSTDVTLLETGKVSNLADYFVVCSGESTAQLRTISETIRKSLAEMGLSPIGEERDRTGQWFLLDYGDIVVHVFSKTARQFYQLEHFWSHARAMNREQWVKEARQAS